MGIRVSAIFLMIVLVTGFTSFPSSLSNYSTEIVDQPHSLNLINTAFADSDNDKGNDKEKGKSDDVGKDKEKHAKNNEDNDDDAMEDAQEAIDDANEEIEKANEKIAKASDKGKETLLAEQQLEEAIVKRDMAQESFDSENFEEAEDLAEEAEDLANEARGKLIGKTQEDLEEDEVELEFEGEIDEINLESMFFTIIGSILKIFVNEDTEFEDFDSLDDLAPGFHVEVEVVLSNGSLVATEIEIEDDDELEFEGEIDEINLESMFFTIVGLVLKIFVNDDTEFEDFDSLDDLAPGFHVEVEVVLSNGSHVATEIEIEDDDEEENDNKIEICHIPPGNPDNAHTINIGKPAVIAHLSHGDVGGACGENSLENILSKKEMKQAEKLTRLAEIQTEKLSLALDRANKLIEKLEQRIAQLEQRLQTLLDKVESGEYYGILTQLDTVKQSHSISFDGTATSIYDESVTTELSGEIFIENLMTGSNTSKFKVTGGEIIVGNNIYDAAFGKVRVSSLGVSGEKDSMVIIIQTFDSEDYDNTIKFTLLFDSAIKADLGTEPLNFEIKPNSKISEQWFLSGSGTLSLE